MQRSQGCGFSNVFLHATFCYFFGRFEMQILVNNLRGRGLKFSPSQPVSSNSENVRKLISKCPVYAPTPLHNCAALAKSLGIKSLFIKDERPRMCLGSFKALGATYAIAKRAAKSAFIDNHPQKSLSNKTFITASAGNHGISVAAGAKVFGANSVVYLSETVPEDFAGKLRDKGAEVVIEGENYEASMQAAADRAKLEGWILLSDSTWEGYSAGYDVMEGYLMMPEEAFSQIDTVPSHIFLQAGVGGLAAAVTASVRSKWGSSPKIVIVEPSEAPAIMESVKAKKPIYADGDVSIMGRLDCKEPSHLALYCLAKEADFFMTLTDSEVLESIQDLNNYDLSTSASGGAGYAGLVKSLHYKNCGIDSDSRVLLFLSEGTADD